MYVELIRISRIHVESGADLEKLEIVRIMASRWVYISGAPKQTYTLYML